MKKARYYFAYNRLLRSEFDLSVAGLSPIDRKKFRNQKPLIISNNGRLQSEHEYVDNQTMVHRLNGYYYKKNIGLFEFISGDEISVLLDCDEFSIDFVRTLLNYPLACVFYQKQIFSLHASAVFFNGKVIVFPGSTLTGKSTIAAYFLKNGGQLVTEDTAVVEVFEDRAYVRSSYPFIKLSKPANDELSFSLSQGILLPTDKSSRRGHLLNNKSFLAESVPIDYCIFLEYADQESVEPMKLSEATLKLLSSSLNIHPLTEAKHKELFHWSARLVQCFKIFRFRRRRGILLSRFLAKFLAEEKF